MDEIVALPGRTSSPEFLMMEGDSADDVNRFVQDLANSDDPSVDSFLQHRPNYLRIGKLAIAMCLVNKGIDRTLSPKYRKQQNNARRHLAWYHYLWREMAAPEGQFGNNSVAFVTLNYDRFDRAVLLPGAES